MVDVNTKPIESNSIINKKKLSVDNLVTDIKLDDHRSFVRSSVRLKLNNKMKGNDTSNQKTNDMEKNLETKMSKSIRKLQKKNSLKDYLTSTEIAQFPNG